MNEYKLIVPIQNLFDLEKLKIKDKVYLNGYLYVFRDQVHKKIANGQLPPFASVNFQNSAVYYCAATPPKNNFVVGSCGPTSSYRMDPYTEILLSLGVKIMIGKGYRSSQVVELCKEYQAVYLITYGGCGALLSQCVKDVKPIAYPELGTEAMYEYKVVDFPAIVAVDTKGVAIWL